MTMYSFGEYPSGRGKNDRAKRAKVHSRIVMLVSVAIVLFIVVFFGWSNYQSNKITTTDNYSIMGSPSNYFAGDELFANLDIWDEYTVNLACSHQKIDIKYEVPQIGSNGLVNYDTSVSGAINLLDNSAAELGIVPPDTRWLLGHSEAHACSGEEVFYEQSYEFSFEGGGQITSSFGLAFVVTRSDNSQFFLNVFHESSADLIAAYITGQQAPDMPSNTANPDPYRNIRQFLKAVTDGKASVEQIAQWSADSNPIALIAAILSIEGEQVTAADINVVLSIFEVAGEDPQYGLSLLTIYFESNREWPYPDLPVPE